MKLPISTLSIAEQDALDALFVAADRLVPFGYFVGYLSPSDVQFALLDEKSLSREEAGECLGRWELQLQQYLMQGEYVRDLLSELRQDPPLNPPSELRGVASSGGPR
jgi:hypothetical protein